MDNKDNDTAVQVESSNEVNNYSMLLIIHQLERIVSNLQYLSVILCTSESTWLGLSTVGAYFRRENYGKQN
jgi:hypothetical protein